MQVHLAVGAEVERRAHRGSAFLARIGQRLAHQKIDDEPDESHTREAG